MFARAPRTLSMPPTIRTNGQVNGTGDGSAASARQVVPPIAPLPAPSRADLQTEYVSGGGWSWYSRLARTLPPSIDDITSDFGDDLYERMALDPTVAKCLAIFKASILEDGVDLNPAVKDDQDDDYKLATTIRDEAEAMLDDLETSLDDVLWNMCDHIALGNVVAEQRYDLKRGTIEKRELLQLVALKPKPRRTYAFVVDAYLNVIGLLGQRPGESNPYMGQVGLDPSHTPNILSREKFAIATFRPRNSDPRGTSILRPAYDPWWRKRQLLPEYLKYLVQFGSPSVWATTPEHAQTQAPLDVYANPVVDGGGNLEPPFTPGTDIPTTNTWGTPPQPVGTYTLSPEQKLLAELMKLRSGTAAAFTFGTVLHVMEMQGDGKALLGAKADCDRDIIGAILTQSLATEEGQHQARAAAEVHQDVLDTLIKQGKRGIVRMFRRDILRPWVLYNWGDRAAHLVPLVSLGHTEPQDLAPLITALGSVGYTIHPSQEPEIDEILNLPVRDMTQDAALDDGTGTGAGVAPPAGGPPGDVVDPSPGKPVLPAVAAVPPSRRAVRAHTRGIPARRVGMSDGVRYSDADKRLLIELFEDALPEYAELLDAKVTDGQ